MTGPQHYAEAEKLLTAANKRLATDDSAWLQTPARRAELRAEAAVHATLALAAASALAESVKLGVIPPAGYGAWAEVVTDQPSAPRAGKE